MVFTGPPRFPISSGHVQQIVRDPVGPHNTVRQPSRCFRSFRWRSVRDAFASAAPVSRATSVDAERDDGQPGGATPPRHTMTAVTAHTAPGAGDGARPAR